MILNNIKGKQKGFTIVELLVVIVVIGILAAITVVSYTGITQKANTTKALSNAQSLQSVVEVYAAENNSVYPATLAAITGNTGSAKLPSGITVTGGVALSDPNDTTVSTYWGAVSSANRPSTVTYACLTSCTSSTGGRITFYDSSTIKQSTTILYVGAGSAAGTFVPAA